MPDDLDDYRTNEGDTLEDTDVSEKDSQESQIENALTKITNANQSSETLAKLMSNPIIREVLTAQDRGEKDIHVVVGKKPPVAGENEESLERDFDNMTNEELVEAMVKQIAPMVGEIVDSKIAPIQQTVQQTSAFMQSNVNDSVQRQIEDVRGKYGDFESHRTEMAEISKQNPGLSIEELYLINKRRLRKPEEEVTPTEKPSATSARPPRKDRKVALPRGQAGWRQLLEESRPEGT